MFKVKSKVKINTARIKQINSAGTTSLIETANALHAEVQQAQVIPRKSGALQNESFFVDSSKAKTGKVSLVNSTPYARRLYYHPEYNFNKSDWVDDDGKHYDGNPNAKGKWFEDWMPEGKNESFCRDTFQKLYRQNGGFK